MADQEAAPYNFDDNLIQGCVFAEYSKMGPESLFSYPIPCDSAGDVPGLEAHYHTFTSQNYMQVAIKSISLLMTDYSFEKDTGGKLESTHIFGVLPYPDMGVIGFTYFTYFYSEEVQHYIPVTLTFLVDERHRSFIYDYINRLKGSMKEFTQNLFKFCAKHILNSEGEAQAYWKEYLPKFIDFFSKVQEIQDKPISPITQKRRIKILFTGLESTGKTSFLLTIKREFSALTSLTPTTEPMKNTLDFLGTTILKLDVPGTASFRKEVLKQAEVYLYETDVIYFFINLQDPRIDESKDYLQKIVDHLHEYDIQVPIICVISKVDEDIAFTTNSLTKISEIKAGIREVIHDHPHKFFHTSIFSAYSILNAFSYGIRQLSPNREMIEHLLWEFIARLKLKTGLLLNENGIVLAAQEITVPTEKKSMQISQIFEVAAPQFTTIAKQFTQIKQTETDRTMKYQFSDKDIIFLKRFTIDDFPLFALFYSQEKDVSAQEIHFDHDFPGFMERIRHLLTLYIS